MSTHILCGIALVVVLLGGCVSNMEFVLRWSYDVRVGNVQVNGKSETYEVRIPVSVEQISSRDFGCPGSAQMPPATHSA